MPLQDHTLETFTRSPWVISECVKAAQVIIAHRRIVYNFKLLPRKHVVFFNHLRIDPSRQKLPVPVSEPLCENDIHEFVFIHEFMKSDILRLPVKIHIVFEHTERHRPRKVNPRMLIESTSKVSNISNSGFVDNRK